VSFRLHPTKNKKLPESEPRKWYQIRCYPEGKAGGLETYVEKGTLTEIREIDLALRRRFHKAAPTVNPQFARVIPEFIEHYQLERVPRTVEAAILHISHLTPVLGFFALSNITGNEIEKYKKLRIGQGIKPITVNKELVTLSVILKWAVDQGYLLTALQIKKFPNKMTRSPVPIMPSAHELAAIVQEVRPEVRGLAMLMLYAGLRVSEALNLRAEDLLLERGLIIVLGKGNKQRIMPVNYPPMVAELAARRDAIGKGYLWVNPNTGKPYGDIRASLKNAAKRAGVSGRVYHHLLRHGFGTTAIESGIDLRSVQGLMGHSVSRTTEIYTHLAATHLINQMEKFHTG